MTRATPPLTSPPWTGDPVRRRWLLGAALGGLPLLQACSPLRLINQALPADTHERIVDIAYGPDPRQRLDLYLPGSGASSADTPTVVFFYGGSWTRGSKDDYRFVGEALAAAGLVAVVADYRLSPAVVFPTFLEDCARAVAWARERQSEAPLFVMGHSAGGYNAAMMALDARWLRRVGMQVTDLKGWIGLAGPYDFLPILNRTVRPVFNWPDTPVDSQPLWHAQRLSPGAATPPALLMAARSDRLVDPLRNTVQLGQTLTAAGAAAEWALLDGVGHATLIGAFARPLRGLSPALDLTAAFIRRHSA